MICHIIWRSIWVSGSTTDTEGGDHDSFSPFDLMDELDNHSRHRECYNLILRRVLDVRLSSMMLAQIPCIKQTLDPVI